MQQSTEQLLARITVSPKVMLGKPAIRGTRLTVEHIFNGVGGGLTYQQLHDDFPFLESADIQACILYGSQLVENERVYSVTT
ncbi:MAG: DUF433 domain-containing protein [Saprospiraceae bacterium]|nr:DUF433 domain-containing protein [Saprospiraceae bacterium]